MHDAELVTLDGRAEAEALMVDACKIERVSGKALDPDTLEEVETWETIYEGKCRFKPGDAQAVAMTEGLREFLVTRARVQLPISAPLMGGGNRVTQTASALDPAQVGRVMWTDSTQAKTHATMRVVTLLEVRPSAD